MDRDRAGLIIMDISGVYGTESFYKGRDAVWVDLKGVPGMNCYCDEEAEQEIMEKIRNLGPEGVHFLDSGNYHYMSKLWMQLLEEDFELLVFDHHTDMQPPMFGDILSCGGWIKAALDSNPHLRRVYLAGPPADAAGQAEVKAYGDRVAWIGEEDMKREGALGKCLEGGNLPLYLSVDKDILGTGYARTNWDQGNVSLDTVLAWIHEAGACRRIIGMDVCGENPEGTGMKGPGSDEAGDSFRDAQINDSANRKLLYSFLELETYESIIRSL